MPRVEIPPGLYCYDFEGRYIWQVSGMSGGPTNGALAILVKKLEPRVPIWDLGRSGLHVCEAGVWYVVEWQYGDDEAMRAAFMRAIQTLQVRDMDALERRAQELHQKQGLLGYGWASNSNLIPWSDIQSWQREQYRMQANAAMEEEHS